MKSFGFWAALLCLPMTGCASLGAGDATPVKSTPSISPVAHSRFAIDDMVDYVDRVSAQTATARNAEVVRLRHGGPRAPADRLKLAYLLSLDEAKAEDIAESNRLLDGLDQAFADSGIVMYVRLLQRTVALEIANAHESARADDLEQKLAQLKKLELDLMRRNQTPAKTGVQTK